MNRKNFIKRGLSGIGAIIGIPTVLSSCKTASADFSISNTCQVSPQEIKGPFPIKTPADYVRENIIGDRTGVALLITIKVKNANDNCKPLVGALVDIWHCDAKGNYSEYNHQVDGDFTHKHFLRGRQTTDANGNASFISIYPGWYPGRAPHLHLEIKSSSGESLLVTQTAFLEDVSTLVYETEGYTTNADTKNTRDMSFKDTLDKNLPDSLTGNTKAGYTYVKTIKVAN
ncbi:MAG: intradiol ring-cleavage dioxygenase [Aureispira sp.]|nr:intradiol ring-cleavage dioxygenase [Aureispira sp.]